jgi:hypothetical protein
MPSARAIRIRRVVSITVLCGLAFVISPPTPASELTLATFLDRLMMAESGGRDDARNPRSTAVGPFQFIEATFLEVTRRHFADETAALTPSQILALRTNRAFARRAAEAYTHDNGAVLLAQGVPATFVNLRLAFLVGPYAAVRLLQAAPESSATGILGPSVIEANPFMARLSAGDLIARAVRDLAAEPTAIAALAPRAGVSAPAVKVRCNLGLASCRRWRALALRRLVKPPAAVAGT